MVKDKKCVTCNIPLNEMSVEKIRDHYTLQHNIPQDDPSLKRYLKYLYIRKKPLSEIKGNNLNRELSKRITRYEKAREKEDVTEIDIRHILERFYALTVNRTVIERGNKDRQIDWFVRTYDVYKSGNITPKGTDAIKSMRLKIEEKREIDFMDPKIKDEFLNESPFEVFCEISTTLFLKLVEEDFIEGVSSELLLEIVVEFIREVDDDDEDGDDFDNEDDEDIEFKNETSSQTNINEYSVGITTASDDISINFIDALSKLKGKVLNSYNIVGSNWSLRRVINLNVSNVYTDNRSLHSTTSNF